ncbi:MAG TPA: nitroreductase family protein [Candidatus Dormibacteraeota bacterium]|nr:nitroreductase family protein [Candidatus Dormibacteraeota bacterium]
MEKPAEAKYPIHEIVRRRWSPRAFSPRAVTADTLRSLFEAARWSPSSFNAQPWAFLVAAKEDRENFDRILDTLVEQNRAWAQRAAVLMINAAKKKFDHDGSLNRHTLYDLGQATAYLTMQATSMGLVVHQMAGFSPAKARELFQIPEEWEPGAAIALGYPAEAREIPEILREKEKVPRVRKPIEEFVFGGMWGRASAIVK